VSDILHHTWFRLYFDTIHTISEHKNFPYRRLDYMSYIEIVTYFQNILQLSLHYLNVQSRNISRRNTAHKCDTLYYVLSSLGE